jgi:AcrR family transcriptional regulator
MARPRQLDAGAPDGSAGALEGQGEATTDAPVARLAANQLRRMRRIVDVAVELAEQGGFDAVRLRDVAERSDVALGTLYKYFRSKEDILLFALNEEVSRLEQSSAAKPLTGGTPSSRVLEFFRRSTRALVRRAPLARAMIRALTDSDQELAVKVAGFHLRIVRLLWAALRGESPDLAGPLEIQAGRGDGRDRDVAFTLMHVWFSAMVGWSAGLHSERGVGDQVRVAAALCLGAEEP